MGDLESDLRPGINTKRGQVMKAIIKHYINKANHHTRMHRNKGINKWLESSEGKAFLSREEVRGKKFWGER